MLHHESFIKKVEGVYNSNFTPGCSFLFYIDVAEFHVFNHRYGVEEGDCLLQALDDFLNRLSIVAVYERVFSDQFVFLIIAPEPKTDEEVHNVFEKRMKEFLASQKKKYQDYNLKISCGIYALTGENIGEAIESANLARKQAKMRGSETAVVFSPSMIKELHLYQENERAIALALHNGQFTFYLQPKVSLLTGKIVGAEALARCIDKNGKVLYPDSFLSIMEENGTIVELDFLILQQVCEFLSDRIKSGLQAIPTSVNLSRLHINNPQTAELLHEVAQKYNVPASLIEFELTESILLNEFSDAKKLINTLRAYGYHVSIDDFGSGYNGLNICQELDFDMLKLDKKFLSDQEPLKSRNIAIVPNVINVGQRLHIDVLCEGVETDEQCQYLLKLGCTIVQGYHFSRPVPKEEFYQTYEEQNGHYPLTCRTWVMSDKSVVKSEPEHKLHFRKAQTLRHVLLTICITLFLSICISLALFVNQTHVNLIFVDSIRSSLSAYASGQVEGIHTRIEDITNTLGAFSDLIKAQQTIELMDTYLATLSENEPEITFQFLPIETFHQAANEMGQAAVDNELVLNKFMSDRERIITDIYYSDIANAFCFAIGYPVFIDERFVGALRAIVNANMLVPTTQYVTSPYGSAIATFITNESGTILLSSNGNQKEIATIMDLVAAFDAGLTSDKLLFGGEQCIRIGEMDGIPHYITSVELNHNGWHMFTLFKADMVGGMKNRLAVQTFICVAIISVSILIAAVLIGIYLIRLRRRIDKERRRYSLLEEFSDTVLFEYDCKTDTMYFTSNFGMIFDMSEIGNIGFLKEIYNRRHTYFADIPAAVDMLLGNKKDDKLEIRIRILGKNNEYRWCMISFRYLYNQDGKLDLVIGKIMDIDDNYQQDIK